MRRLTVVLFVFLAAGVARSQSVGRAYVVNGAAETLSIIHLETGVVENDAVLLGDIPGEMALWDGLLYVVNSGSNNLQVIDPLAKTTLSTIELGPDNNPFDLEITPSGTAYVSNFVSNVVFVLDLQNQTVTDTIAVGLSPEGIRVVGDHLYVCNTGFDPLTFGYRSGTVSVVDTRTNTVVDTIAVGTNPQDVALGADSLVHVVATGNFADTEGAVYVIDPASRAVVDTIAVGGQPAAITVSPDGMAYLAAGGWVDRGFVYSYDTRSHQIFNGKENPLEAGTGVIDVAASQDSTLYVVSWSVDEVSHLGRDGSTLMSWGVGDGPSNIFLDERNVSAVDAQGPSVGVPTRFTLHQNYPNPFTAAASAGGRTATGTTILVELTVSATVDLAIFDLLGRRVAQVYDGPLSAGPHRFHFDGRGLAAGVYFYRLMSPGFSAARRMTVVR